MTQHQDRPAGVPWDAMGPERFDADLAAGHERRQWEAAATLFPDLPARPAAKRGTAAAAPQLPGQGDMFGGTS